MTAIPDQEARTYAETTFDRNVVVLAGAGTGKTSLLINRLVHALVREPDPFAMTEILALTFTNKAATDLKVRLRDRLSALLLASTKGETLGEQEGPQVRLLRERYGLPASEIAARAKAALHDLEKAQIGTLHSFAAHLLRLHPIESGVDPGFREDEGDRFEEHFRAQWDLWISAELGPGGGRHSRWRPVLEQVGLQTLRELADALCSELVSLEDLRAQLSASDAPAAICDWIVAREQRAADLLATYEGAKRRKLEALLAGALDVIRQVAKQGVGSPPPVDPSWRESLDKAGLGQPAGWADGDFQEARRLIRTATQLLAVEHAFLREVIELLAPLIERVRASFLRMGWISFDGLLARARTLLREHRHVRERLKGTYRSILIDEFQDTDPVQYEILFYLAERQGRFSREWADVELEPGKLFIVGDPKQSIYAFRRADIEAFHRVVARVLATGGAVRELVTNFRSDPAVLEVVNAAFDTLFCPEPNVQPPNIPLRARVGRRPRVRTPGVELRLIRAAEDEEDFDAAAATRAEADALARWLKEELLDRETLLDEEGRASPLRPGHIALLFRKLTQAQDYLEALARLGIPYVTEGEKHFYRRQEVIDLVNVLRAIENPHDRIGLVGVLRSPLGGVTDRELAELARLEALDYRRGDRLKGWASPRAEAIRALYARLHRLSRALPLLPLPDAVEQVFHELPVLELAGASLHGDQAIANLQKVRRIAEDLADRAHLTLTTFVELILDRLAEEPGEGEGALAEPSLDALQVLTIHKAKGLEFPVVVLPGLHQGGGPGFSAKSVTLDWSTGVLGLSVGRRCSLGAVMTEDKYQVREEAERRRVLYVGMTRAKERVVLSGGLPASAARGRFLDLLEEAGWRVPRKGQRADGVQETKLGPVTVAVASRPGRSRRSPKAGTRPASDWAEVLRRWQERNQRYAEAEASPPVMTPSRLGGDLRDSEARAIPGSFGRDLAQLVGTLAHRVLEIWDYASDDRQLEPQIEAVCQHEVPPEWEARRGEITREVTDILRAYVGSPAYEELRRATILGREVPFAIPWAPAIPDAAGGQPQPCLMEGVIDVVYRLDGGIWVADYKTDRAPVQGIDERVERYRAQGQVYRRAVGLALGLEKVGYKLIFLRHGLAVDVHP